MLGMAKFRHHVLGPATLGLVLLVPQARGSVFVSRGALDPGPEVVFVVSGHVGSDNVFGITTPETREFEGTNTGWTESIARPTGSIQSTGSVSGGSLTGSVNALLDFTPQCFGCSDEFNFGATVEIYVRGCSQGYVFDYSANGQLSVAHPNGCSGTWGPHGLATFGSQSVGSSTDCSQGTISISQPVGFSGVSSSTTRTFPLWPGVEYSLATTRSLSALAFQSDGAHIFDPYRRIVASVNASFTLTVSLSPVAQPPAVAVRQQSPCALCGRTVAFSGDATDPDQSPPGPGAGIVAWNWTFPGAASSTGAGSMGSATWTSPGGYSASLSVRDDECETRESSSGVSVVAPKAKILKLATRGRAGSLATDIAETVRSILSRKGWEADIYSPVSPDDMRGALNDPCIKGLVIVGHGIGSYCNLVKIEPPTGQASTFERPNLREWLANAGVDLEFLAMLVCYSDSKQWTDFLDPTGGIKPINPFSRRTRPETPGCVGAMNAGSEASWPPFFDSAGLDPYGFPVACPGASSPEAGPRAKLMSRASSDTSCGVLMICDTLGTCGDSLYPVVACANSRLRPTGHETGCSSVAGGFDVRAYWPGGCNDSVSVRADLFSGSPRALFTPFIRVLPRFLWVDGLGCGNQPPDSLRVSLAYTDAELAAAGIPESRLAAFYLVPGTEGGLFPRATIDTVLNRTTVWIPDTGVLLLGEAAATSTPLVPPATPQVHELRVVGAHPARGPITVEFGVPREGEYSVAVFDLAGRRVATLFEGRCAPGWQRGTWDALSVTTGTSPGGVYFVCLRGADRVVARKLVVIGRGH